MSDYVVEDGKVFEKEELSLEALTGMISALAEQIDTLTDQAAQLAAEKEYLEDKRTEAYGE